MKKVRFRREREQKKFGVCINNIYRNSNIFTFDLQFLFCNTLNPRWIFLKLGFVELCFLLLQKSHLERYKKQQNHSLIGIMLILQGSSPNTMISEALSYAFQQVYNAGPVSWVLIILTIIVMAILILAWKKNKTRPEKVLNELQKGGFDIMMGVIFVFVGISADVAIFSSIEFRAALIFMGLLLIVKNRDLYTRIFGKKKKPKRENHDKLVWDRRGRLMWRQK